MTTLENAPSKTGKPSGNRRGNNPPPSKTGKPSGDPRGNNPPRGK